MEAATKPKRGISAWPELRNAARIAILASTLAVSMAANAYQVDWAHQNGSLSSNGAVTVKTVGGNSYTGTRNPTGAVAKSNQNAVTQAPTVIIQATASNNFNYNDNCYYLTVNPSGQPFQLLGAGKMSGSNFSGVVASAVGSSSSSSGARVVLNILFGTDVGIMSGGAMYEAVAPVYCGSNGSCPIQNLYAGGSNTQYSGVFLVTSMATTSATKCMP